MSTSDSDDPVPRSRSWTVRRFGLWFTLGVVFVLVAAAVTLIPLVRMVRTPEFDTAPDQADTVFVFAGESARLELALIGDYHGARTRMLLDRCLDGTASFALVDWDGVGWSVVRHEVAGLWTARFLDRSC